MTGLVDGSSESPQRYRRYGSIMGSPPNDENSVPKKPKHMPSLELPDPAMVESVRRPPESQTSWRIQQPTTVLSAQRSHESEDAYHIGRTHIPHKPFGVSIPRHMLPAKNRRTMSTPGGGITKSRPLLKHLFSTASAESPRTPDVSLSQFPELDARQVDFFKFLDDQLEKVEVFYKSKEDEASHRLGVLRDQLHIMRDRRVEEFNAAKHVEHINGEGPLDSVLHPNGDNKETANGHKPSLLKQLSGGLRKGSHIGKTSQAMGKLGSPSSPSAQNPDARRDYVKKHVHEENVPYRAAKRKLKLAFQEFYRGLELLKSYAILNRTAFRKINKKYDKAANARPTGRYMTEKVNKAYFVHSDTVDSYLVAVEDLYARYFERGNHKIAVAKLRSSSRRWVHHSSNSFRNGCAIAGGLIFGIQGIVYSVSDLYSSDPNIYTQTTYLLQLYAGYFMAVLLFLIFVVACRVWTAAKVNYMFVFEYDTREVLDWRQLAELPCWFFFLNGLFLWLNFRPGGHGTMFKYWPVVLIGITVIVMFMPFPILYPKARKWWAFSNWRLLLAGIYPVEFRDFLLGDMYCSETYAMGNVEVFFCLYGNAWNNPGQCASTYSRALGFMTTLPGIWRAAQCIRRYRDSGSWFPHLANCAKYGCNILYYMSLSMYRINESNHMKALFIVFAMINGVYCSFWDVYFDWSLGQLYGPHPFLRPNLAFRQRWPYYVAMILDPILRQQWIFYAVYAHDLQHSSIVSFGVGVTEVLRRGMWLIFRVENEHCNNVGRFRASRDIPLPYSLPSSPKENEHWPRPEDDLHHAQSATGADAEQTPQTQDSSLRLRRSHTHTATGPTSPVERAIHRAGTIIGMAHAQDYERKKDPASSGRSPASHRYTHGEDSDDDEDGEDLNSDDEDMMLVQKVLSRTRSHGRPGGH